MEAASATRVPGLWVYTQSLGNSSRSNLGSVVANAAPEAVSATSRVRAHIPLFFSMLSNKKMVHRVGPRPRGRRYSLDVNADNSYGAAHLYLTHVKGHPGCGMP